MNLLTILQGDCLEQLRTLPDESVQCCVCSPPYWGLRDYGVAGQLGLEKTPEEYVAKMVEVFGEVRRVLRGDGTCWVNLGDCYSAQAGQRKSTDARGPKQLTNRGSSDLGSRDVSGLKPKDLVGVPWRVAFALQADGWYLRSDIIWHKPNPMPESVTDRPTKAHEYMFLLSKSASYYYDAEAIKETSEYIHRRSNSAVSRNGTGRKDCDREIGDMGTEGSRNKRTVWTVPTAPYSEAHFATFPPDLIKPCILAGTSARGCCPKCGAPWERITERIDQGYNGSKYGDRAVSASGGAISGGTAKSTLGSSNGKLTGRQATLDWKPSCECQYASNDGDGVTYQDEFSPNEPVPCTILDPFAGSGTTGQVALEFGRKAILVELNPKYCDLIRQHCNVTPGLTLA